MGMFGALKRKPMFGEIPGMGRGPYDTPPTWGGPPQETMGGVGAMEPNTQAMTKKPNFFQKNGNTIIGVIGDTLATLGGGQGVYAPAMIAQKQQDAEIRARLQAALEQRKAAREDKQWEWENKPQEDKDQLTRYMRAAGIDPMSDQGRKMYAQAAMNSANPLQGVPYTDEQGNSGLKFIRPGDMGQGGAAPTSKEDYDKLPAGAQYRAPDGSIRTKGGGVGNGTGGF
jgi:hypothetical protein